MTYDFDEIIQRKGTNAMSTDGFREYIFKADDTMEFPYKDEDFVRMWIADMEFATPPFIIEGIQRRLEKRSLGYTKVFDEGYYEAFESWCRKYYDFEFQRESLHTGHGIIPALYELVEYITEPDEKVLIMTPSYAYFQYAADYNKRELVTTDLIRDEEGQYYIDFADFEEKARDEKVRLLIFCNPHNPTGRAWTEEELERVGRICLENDVWIITDEIHCDLLRTGRKHIPLAKVFPDQEKLITCMATSKTFNMAGLMISNIIIPDPGIRAIWQERHYGFDNPLSIAAVQAAYEHGDEWLAQLKAYLDDNFNFLADFLAKELPEASFRIPDSTYLAWVDMAAYLQGVDDVPLFFANRAGVLLEGGDMFVANSHGFIRLNLACPRSILEEGVIRIKDAILKYRQESLGV